MNLGGYKKLAKKQMYELSRVSEDIKEIHAKLQYESLPPHVAVLIVTESYYLTMVYDMESVLVGYHKQKKRKGRHR